MFAGRYSGQLASLSRAGTQRRNPVPCRRTSLRTDFRPMPSADRDRARAVTSVRFPEVRDGYDRLGMVTAIPKVGEANAHSSLLFGATPEGTGFADLTIEGKQPGVAMLAVTQRLRSVAHRPHLPWKLCSTC